MTKKFRRSIEKGKRAGKRRKQDEPLFTPSSLRWKFFRHESERREREREREERDFSSSLLHSRASEKEERRG